MEKPLFGTYKITKENFKVPNRIKIFVTKRGITLIIKKPKQCKKH